MQPEKAGQEAFDARADSKPKFSGSVTPGVATALLIAQCFGGAWSIASRQWIAEGRGVGYSVFLTYRYLISGAALLAASWTLEGNGPGPPRHVSTWELLALAGLCFVASASFLCAVGSIGSFLPALGETLVPVYVCAVCVISRLEAVRRGKAAGVACAVVGAALVVAREEMRRASAGGFLETSDNPHVAGLVVRHVSALWLERPTALTMGLAMLAVHIFTGGNFWMLKKQFLYRSSPLHLSAYVYFTGSCLSLASAICMGHAFLLDTWRPSEKNIYALGFSLFESTVGTGLAAWATKRTKATNVVASFTLQPVTSSLLSWIVLRTPLQCDHVVGMMLTTCGLLLVVYSQGEDDKHAGAVETKRSADKLLP